MATATRFTNDPIPQASYKSSLWMPRFICYPSSATLSRRLPLTLRSYYDRLCSEGWRFYVTEIRTAYCHINERVITIPLFSLGRESELVIWFMAHEMTHAISGEDNHTPEFYETFKEICPKNCWTYERDYKPRGAAHLIGG